MATPPPAGRPWVELKRLVVTLLPVAIPLLVGWGVLEALAWRVGETMPMARIAEWQSGSPERMWRGGDGRSYLTYKVARVQVVKPEVIALGSSRANSFRADAFAPASFYNAGLTAWTFDHYRRFLELVSARGYAPKVMVVNFDYWMFGAGFEQLWVERFYETRASHAAELKVIVDQLASDPLTLWRRLPAADHLRGLYALLSGDGFRPDGSLLGPPPTPDPQRLLRDGTAVGVPPVELGDRISSEQTRKFERFMSTARARNITVIGIQLPYHARIFEGLEAHPGAGIWREFRTPEWRRYVGEQGLIFFDMAEMREYSQRPEHFVDSIHPDARVVRHVMQIVMADPRVRAALPGRIGP